MAIPISQRIPNNEEEFYRQMMEAWARTIRVAIPGIIQSFDPVEQTVTVQPAIRERIQDPNTLEHSWVNLPLLVDVPVVLPRAGGFSITFPIQKGDECLVVFGDMCMDAWWANGGVQNQMETRRHDLSDGFAIVGVTSQPRRLSGWSTDALQIRTDDGATYISVKPGEIDLVASTVKVNGTVIG
ncbi:Gp138 family membrane-puncturing spike protein [Alicyclobacillus macrosporangiidus]|uniref:Phage protein Gp138 N-terminal domain-containing protein n=1 Tax=Alicyclobacillus macrosporangiidus TaxID=392015 RepID=A0A1I7IEE4_9BACL|nr:Gp138 family membrane-puncturing spike protein [Alicyclobacillus macrosporangiidus]SFU71268.1 hypothetical protein SAMN05421543_106169 [Alicyclobacillus macrosporangiidus]